MPSLTDPRRSVNPPRHDQKVVEVAKYVAALQLRRGMPIDADDAFQEAALWALEWNERYGAGHTGSPFNPMTATALTRTTNFAFRYRHQLTITDDAIRKRKRIASYVPAEQLEERLEDLGDGEPLRLEGEADRRRGLGQLLRGIRKRERRLVRAVFERSVDDLRALALRCKTSYKRARALVRRILDVMGADPMVAHLQRFVRERPPARDPRLPEVGAELAHGALRCTVLADGFSYAGKTYSSISAAARAAAADAGKFSEAVNGFRFWGLENGGRLLSAAWDEKGKAPTRAAASRRRKRSRTCMPSGTSRRRKAPRRSVVRRRQSTSASPTLAHCRRSPRKKKAASRSRRS